MSLFSTIATLFQRTTKGRAPSSASPSTKTLWVSNGDGDDSAISENVVMINSLDNVDNEYEDNDGKEVNNLRKVQIKVCNSGKTNNRKKVGV